MSSNILSEYNVSYSLCCPPSGLGESDLTLVSAWSWEQTRHCIYSMLRSKGYSYYPSLLLEKPQKRKKKIFLSVFFEDPLNKINGGHWNLLGSETGTNAVYAATYAGSLRACLGALQLPISYSLCA